MQELPILVSASPCVCGRDFDWKRISQPNVEKGDSDTWVIALCADANHPHWIALMTRLEQRNLFQSANWGVLLVTTETPEQQLSSDLYKQFDCKYIRTLSDPEMTVAQHFGISELLEREPLILLLVSQGRLEAQLQPILS